MAQQLELFGSDQPASPPADARRQVAPERAPVAEKRLIQSKADLLRAELQAQISFLVQLTITNNSSTMMSLRFNPAGTVARLRLHHMFLDAPPTVRRALASWVRRPKSGGPGKVLDAFIRAEQHKVAARPPRAIRIRTAGTYHDLRRLFDEVNAAHFGGAIRCAITWGKMPSRGRRRSIRFGSYVPGDEIIRMHPLLDQDFVPDFFVRYIVFHEMLHAELGIEELPSGRRAIHPPAFRKREEAYPDYARAVAWMENSRNLGRLLRHPAPRG